LRISIVFLCRIPGQARDRCADFRPYWDYIQTKPLPKQSGPRSIVPLHLAATYRKPQYALGKFAVEGLLDASNLHFIVPSVTGLPFAILPSFMETQPGFSGNLATIQRGFVVAGALIHHVGLRLSWCALEEQKKRADFAIGPRKDSRLRIEFSTCRPCRRPVHRDRRLLRPSSRLPSLQQRALRW
jgi:hypothetical protein